ncbi:subtilisin-like protease SBT5.3 [Chenopodium quinoa]|uniref:subtilisin-like protease SBT5.3 n=1 Tax=Chenopodium quinoa TaxID=63459 RepID=UPI000B79A848|nr:subtilisin-like protease SBT5.3 [Chenopodium quinoa]
MGHSIVLHSLLSILLLPLLQAPVVAVCKHYIVYLGSFDGGRPFLGDPANVTRSHHEMISNVSQRNNNGHDPSKKLIYSYAKIFNGFAAILHEEEVEELAKHPNVISIFENLNVRRQTTQSWDFLGSFQHQIIPSKESIWEKACFGEDIIIGAFDTGVWPESKSFSDEGLGIVPKKFRGHCSNDNDPSFKCNRKLIGARYFNKGYVQSLSSKNLTFSTNSSPRDMGGHGTHTLSTAGGSVVLEADAMSLTMLGLKNSTIKGGAPMARVVAYKVLWPEAASKLGEGSFMDCLAAVEAAILDGVDIINLSLGFTIQDSMKGGDFYFKDALSIASFHAMANGILVIATAGNSGPSSGSVNNIAPWMLTVGASTIGREFTCCVVLGNNQTIRVCNFYSSLNDTSFYPLITGANARINGANQIKASYCKHGTVDPVKAKGKLLVCLLEGPGRIIEKSEKSKVALQAGALGLIIANNQFVGSKMLPDMIHPLPTTQLKFDDGQALLSYISSTRDPIASITGARTELGIKPAPIIAYFSSRGPNKITPEILKPDVIAPGVSIVAAYTEAPNVPLPDKFLPLSGTSMAAPHVTGIAALLRKMYPLWTTSAIKSAIMTTTSSVDNNDKPIFEDDMIREATPFAYGAGLVQPNLAMDPGLVYDMNHYDYLSFLCAHHYNTTLLKLFNKQHDYKCPESFNILDFNYPSISIPEFTGAATATRKLKNVGEPGTYTASIQAPPEISIVVEPKTLVFCQKDQELTFKLIFSADVNQLPTGYIFGSLVWSDGKHIVRSPIAMKGKASVGNTLSKSP